MARPTHLAFSGATLLMDDGFRARLLLAWRLLWDDRVSPLKYAVPMLLAMYIASPIDTIPDVLLGLGQIDDLGIAVIALMLFVRIMPWLAPSEVVAEYSGATRRAAPPDLRDTNRAHEAVEADFRIRGERA